MIKNPVKGCIMKKINMGCGASCEDNEGGTQHLPTDEAHGNTETSAHKNGRSDGGKHLKSKDKILIHVIEPTASSDRGTLQSASPSVNQSSGRDSARKSYDMPEVMICYDNPDIDTAIYIKDKLMSHCINVWMMTVDMNKTKVSSISSKLHVGKVPANAILDAKVMIVVMSENSAKSRHCQDEICLAYISQTPIFPVGLQWFKQIDNHMSPGLKLMLSKINWTFFAKTEMIEEKMDDLIENVKRELLKKSKGDGSEGTSNHTSLRHKSNPSSPKRSPRSPRSHARANSSSPETTPSRLETRDASCDQDELKFTGFWDRHFCHCDNVQWIEFRNQLWKEYGEDIIDQFPEESQQRWFTNIFYQNVLLMSKTITRQTYNKFIGMNKSGDDISSSALPDLVPRKQSIASASNVNVEEEMENDSLECEDRQHTFYNRLKDYAIGIFAINEVFAMDSKVRWTAINNLTRFQSVTVTDALIELTQPTSNRDINLRVVATLALGRTNNKLYRYKVLKTLHNLLHDDDRLVRQSACISLGAIKCDTTSVIDSLINLWRNDPIKEVRDAALLAIKLTGHSKGKICVEMTERLAGDVRILQETVRRH